MNVLNDLPEVLTLSELAIFLKVTNQTIYNMIWDKRIPAFKAGRSWRIKREDVAKYIESNSNKK